MVSGQHRSIKMNKLFYENPNGFPDGGKRWPEGGSASPQTSD